MKSPRTVPLGLALAIGFVVVLLVAQVIIQLMMRDVESGTIKTHDWYHCEKAK